MTEPFYLNLPAVLCSYFALWPYTLCITIFFITPSFSYGAICIVSIFLPSLSETYQQCLHPGIQRCSHLQLKHKKMLLVHGKMPSFAVVTAPLPLTSTFSIPVDSLLFSVFSFAPPVQGHHFQEIVIPSVSFYKMSSCFLLSCDVTSALVQLKPFSFLPSFPPFIFHSCSLLCFSLCH